MTHILCVCLCVSMRACALERKSRVDHLQVLLSLTCTLPLSKNSNALQLMRPSCP